MLPSETDVSSWFNIWQDRRTIYFQATDTALGSSEFYGKTYEFQIKVRMNPTEIIDDSQVNLEAASAMGFKTWLVAEGTEFMEAFND